MVFFNIENAPKKWFCQIGNGCILFALINSGKLNPKLFSWLKPNENLRKKTLEEQVLFKLRVITVWALITGYYPFDHKETFYTIYSAFMKFRDKKGKISEKDYKDGVLHYAKKINLLENFFVQHDEKSLNDGTWDAGKRMKLKVEDFTTLEDLPYKSLLCIENMHWVVYLGVDGDSVMALDSLICNGYNRIPISKLLGQKIIKPGNIEVSQKVYDMLLEFYVNPKEMIRNLRREEFSRKIAECIWRLKQINYAKPDYTCLV